MTVVATSIGESHCLTSVSASHERAHPFGRFSVKPKVFVIFFAIAVPLLVLSACERSGSSNAEKAIKSTKSGDTTIALSSASGEIKSGENELTLSFTDASGGSLDIPAASLKFHMPAMGSMAEMSDVATLTTTDTPGKFRVRVSVETGGSWEAMISFQGSRGTEHATMSVNAK
jgi:YtkA-like